MYILCKLEKRAETTDTLLYYAASDRKILEEILLSLFDELYESEINAYINDPQPVSDNAARFWAIQRLSDFSIVWVPYIM